MKLYDFVTNIRVDKDGVQEEGPYAGRKNPEFTRRPRMRRYRPPPPPEDYEEPAEEQPKKKKKKKGPVYCPDGKTKIIHLLIPNTILDSIF